MGSLIVGEVFLGYIEHPKALAILFAQVFVVYFVRPAQCQEVPHLCVSKPLEPLVDQYIVHQEVSDPIERDAHSDKQQYIDLGLQTSDHQQRAGQGKYQKESIVFLKELALGAVVVFVQIPQQPVHYVFVGEPGNDLHKAKGGQCGEGIEQVGKHFSKGIKPARLYQF